MAIIIQNVLDKMYRMCIVIPMRLYKSHTTFNRIRRDHMSNYEMQIRATEKYYDDAIRAAEQENIEVLSSVVPGSRLHQLIHNPVDSGIDEG
jgi:hypothetical protein